MSSADVHVAVDGAEADRIAALERYAVLDTAPEPEFDGLTALAAQLCGVPMAGIVLVGADRLFFKSRLGFTGDASAAGSLCLRAIRSPDVLLVADVSADPGFSELHRPETPVPVRLFAGAPLVAPDGFRLGALCVAADWPGTLDAAKVSALAALAHQAVQLLELRLANRRLDGARHFAQATMDALDSGVCVLDERGAILATNAQWDRVAGQIAGPPGVLASRPGDSFLEGCDRAGVSNESGISNLAAGIRSVLAGAHDGVAVEVSGAGGREWYLARVTRFGVDRPLRAVLALEDISERRRAEEDLRESRQILEQAQAVGCIGSWSAGLDSEATIQWSAETARIFGFRPGEFDGRLTTFLGAVVSEDRPRVWSTSRKAVEGLGHFVVEYRILRRDGRLRWIHQAADIERSPEGRALRVVGVVQDITEKKEAEAAFRASVQGTTAVGEAFFPALVRELATALKVRYAFVGVIEAGRRERVRTVALWADGAPAENIAYDLEGTPCAQVIGREPCHFPGGVAGLFPEDRLLAELGAEAYLGAPLFGANGRPLGIIVVLHDRPLPLPESARDLLQLFSSRAAAELERADAERRNRQLNRVLAVLGAVNQAIIRTARAPDLMWDACRIAVAQGGFGFAWIGLSARPGGPVDLAAHAGGDAEMVELVRAALAPEPLHGGCHFTAAALAGATVSFCDDIAADPHIAPWREVLVGRGYRSMCCLPLRSRGRTIGCLNLYAPQPGFFNAEELGVLVELAADLSFGIEVAEREQLRLEGEIALLAAHDRYAALVNHVEAVVWEADPASGRFTFVSRQAEALLGHPVRQWLDEPGFWAAHLHPEDREAAGRARDAGVARGGTHDFEYRMLAADGRVVWIHHSATAEGGPDRPVALRGLLVDITSRREREAELREKSALLGAILDTSVTAVTVLNPDGRIVYANPRAESVLGLRRDELLRREYDSPGWCATTPEGEPLADADMPFRRVLTTGEPVFEVEHAISWPDGQRRQLSVNGAPIRDARGEITSLVFSVSDITRRKEAEMALLRLSAVVEQSTENVLITDRDGVILYVNRAFEETFGHTQEMARGRTPKILNSGRMPREFFTRLWTTIRSGRIFTGEFINRRRSGELCFVEQIVMPIRDARGEITHFASVGRDITRRKQAEQVMRDEQVLNHTLLENLAALFFVFNAGGRMLRWNRNLEAVLGVTGAQLQASRPLDFVLPAERAAAEAAIRTAFAEGNASIELHVQAVNGRVAPYYFVARAVELNGEPALVGLGFDLRERREAEAEIRRLAAFPALNPEPVLEFSAAGELTYRNAASDALAQQVGLDDFRRLLPVELPEIVRGCLSTGEPCLRLETVCGEHTLSWSFIPIRHQDRVHGYVSDITDRVRREQLARRSQRLESIGTLAGGIAHDLNNTLTPITMGIQMFRHEHPSECELADAIEQSAQRAAGMVRQLLNFAKGAGGRRVTLEAPTLVRELRQLVARTFPKNITLEIPEAEVLAEFSGDPVQLHQVLLNLCVNARDAMPDGGTLTVDAGIRELGPEDAAHVLSARPGRFVVFRVMDTGTGIEPAVLDRIFDPFFTTKGADKGTGLGLSNALGIVRGHDGFIHVRSQPGLGTQFEVYLPVRKSSEAGVLAAAAESAPLPAGGGQTILFVDDETQVAALARRLLQLLRYRPLIAGSAAEGCELVRRHGREIAGIITDLQMPGRDGLDFAREVRTLLPTVPIVVASGRLEDGVAAAFEAIGVTVRLDKPFSAPQFAAVLADALKQTGAGESP